MADFLDLKKKKHEKFSAQFITDDVLGRKLSDAFNTANRKQKA